MLGFYSTTSMGTARGAFIFEVSGQTQLWRSMSSTVLALQGGSGRAAKNSAGVQTVMLR